MNSELAVDFEWFRCPQGYRIVGRGENNVRFMRPDPYDATDPWVTDPTPYLISAKSPERIPYRPLNGQGSLTAEFSQVKAPGDLLEFVKRYGPLTPEGLKSNNAEKGDLIDDCLSTARAFRNLLSCKSKGPKKVAAVFEAQCRANWTSEPWAQGKTLWENLKVFIGKIELVPDPARGVRLKLTTSCLLGAMWWQLSLKLWGATSFRECRQCGDLFEVGPGAGVRADATFCCPEHSVLFHSLKRSKGA